MKLQVSEKEKVYLDVYSRAMQGWLSCRSHVFTSNDDTIRIAHQSVDKIAKLAIEEIERIGNE